jgi:hypothetical protein
LGCFHIFAYECCEYSFTNFYITVCFILLGIYSIRIFILSNFKTYYKYAVTKIVVVIKQGYIEQENRTESLEINTYPYAQLLLDKCIYIYIYIYTHTLWIYIFKMGHLNVRLKSIKCSEEYTGKDLCEIEDNSFPTELPWHAYWNQEVWVLRFYYF